LMVSILPPFDMAQTKYNTNPDAAERAIPAAP